MTADLLFILTTDGLANGSIYLLAGLGLVLIFSVSRVIFVPFGDIAAFSALSLGLIQKGQTPSVVFLLLMLSAVAVVIEFFKLIREGKFKLLPKAFFTWFCLPMLPVALIRLLSGHEISNLNAMLVAIALVTPLGPLINKIAIEPISSASTLILLMVSLALHFLLSGLGLIYFGPEGYRTPAMLEGMVNFSEGYAVASQSILMFASAILLSFLLYAMFEFTLIGKSLRATAVNRMGSKIVGIRSSQTANLSFLLSSFLAGLIGVLIAPVNTLYYDSGFIIGLKAFVAAIIGGMVSFPLTALGAVVVGILESFASFWSGAFKDVIVFSLLIPVLIFRSWQSVHSDEDVEEIDQ
jgi:branched-chain amino acid transport system permease protein